jgi:hypothetical protein
MGCNSSKMNIIVPEKETKLITETIKKVFTPTGDFEKDKARGETYAKVVGMDQANTKIAVIMSTQGFEAGAKAMFTGDNNKKLSYSEMRQMYG